MVNKAIIVGRLGRDPETRMTQNGKTVCNFTMATDTGFGESKTTDWHRIVCFDKQANYVSNYCRKGSLVYVEGRISYRQYEKDGQKQYITEIIANTVQGLGGRNENQGGFSGGYAGSSDPYDSPVYGNQGGSYNAAPSYNNAPMNSAPTYAPAAQPPAEPFGGNPTGLENDEIPF